MLIREIFPPSPKKETIRVLLLLSGGLDSVLAGCILQDQGLEIVGLTFESPFFGAERAVSEARRMNWPLVVVDITEEEIQIVEKPKYGYGRHMNPCLDCHLQMVRLAGQLLPRYQAAFVATGEVLGERPLSQNRQALQIVERESRLEGYVLRPLSAQLLPETEVEKKGWVKREALLDIQGRSRKRQMELAEKYQLEGYATPSGGCLLTDPGYSARLRKLRSWRGRLKKEDIWLLRYGRHFFGSDYWVVIGRDEGENRILKQLALPEDIKMTTVSKKGPQTVVRFKKKETPVKIREAALLTIRYSQARREEKAIVKWSSRAKEEKLELAKAEWSKYLTENYNLRSTSIAYRELTEDYNP